MMTGSSKALLACASIGAAALATPGAAAEILYEQASGGLTGHNAVSDVQADDFTLLENGIVTQATISIFEIGADQWDGNVQYFLFADSGNKPANVIASGLGQNISQTVTNVNGSGWEFSDVTFDLVNPVGLDAGEKYWLGVVLSDTFDSGDQVFWTATSSQVGSRSKSNSSFAVPQTGWTNNTFDFAFQIGGEIPTPGSLAMLGLGGLTMARRRRR